MLGFSNKYIQGLLILLCFGVFIVIPSISPEELGFTIPYIYEWNENMKYGILHIDSLLFVGFTAFILWLSIERDIKKAKKLHLDKRNGFMEAEKSFESFFESTITLNDLVEKSKKNHVIDKILHLLGHGAIEDDLVLGTQKIYLNIASSYSKLKNDYEYLATVMPIIGMIGTVAGLLMMFSEPTQAEDFEKKFAGLSIALSTTLYASLFTILWFKPNARSVEQWQTDLDEDFENLEISVRKFYHKVNLLELTDLQNHQNNQEFNDETEK